MTINNLTDKFRVYPNIDSHHRDKETTYVNIRVVARKNRNKTIDVPVYFEDGERMKVKRKSFENGKIRKGYYSDLETRRINDRIKDVFDKIKNYVGTTADNVSRHTIEGKIYTPAFLEQFKNSRAKSILVNETKRKVSDVFIELRKSYPKRIEVEIVSYIDADGFERDERKEIVIDPLDFNAPDFPKNFPQELYAELAKDYKGSDNTFFKDNFVKFKAGMLFYSHPQITNTLRISPQAVHELTKAKGRKLSDANYSVTIKDKSNTVIKEEQITDKTDLIALQRKIDVAKMRTEDVYKKSLFDKTDLLHVFASVYFDTLENQQNERIVIRLFDYVVNTGVNTNVKQYNDTWVRNFMSWIDENGYTNQSAKMFDPLKYDRNMFLNKERKKYNGGGLKKQLVSLRIVGKHLEKNGLLPYVNYEEIKIGEWRTVQDGTRNSHTLLLGEYETLLNYKFTSSKEREYQTIFEQLKKAGLVGVKNDVTIDNLKTYRDVFCLQIMLGGLRGLDEYNTVELIDYDKEGKAVRMFQDKVDKTVLNPLNRYADAILKRNKNKLPKPKVSYETLNAYIKLISHIASLDREVEKGVTIKENISQYWARKSFGNILFSEGVSEDQIALFTGHETRKSELGRSYLDRQNVKLKRKIYRDIGFLK